MSNRKLEKTSEIVDEIAGYRRQLALARAELADLQAELDDQLVSSGTANADSLATKVAMKERECAALGRKIAKLEMTTLPDARDADALAGRQVAIQKAKDFHRAWEADARELVEQCAALNDLWLSFRAKEAEYAQLADAAGFETREISATAVVAMVNALMPAIMSELSSALGIRAMGRQDQLSPVDVVARQMLTRFARRQS